MLKRLLPALPVILGTTSVYAQYAKEAPVIHDEAYLEFQDPRTWPKIPSSSRTELSGAELVNRTGVYLEPQNSVDGYRKASDEVDTAGMIKFNPDELKNPEDWKRKYFDVVIWVNKSNEGKDSQTMELYQHGVLIHKTKISSGRETVEVASNLNDPHKPKRTYFSSTPTGYYTPHYLNIDHVSSLWEDSFMPYAVFFNGGVAIHQVPNGKEAMIGKRASGGCVRTPSDFAPDFFWRVRMTGGPFSQVESNKKSFTAQAAYYRPFYMDPYNETPMIPKFTKRGTLVVREDGTVEMKKGFKTLVIVENAKFDTEIPIPTARPKDLGKPQQFATNEVVNSAELDQDPFDKPGPVIPPKDIRPIHVKKARPQSIQTTATADSSQQKPKSLVKPNKAEKKPKKSLLDLFRIRL